MISDAQTIASTVFQSDDFLAKRYDLVRRIGQGGMSAVYLARDRQLDRPVAVKVMLPFEDVDAESSTIRFVNEARILARLNHPNIVHVYDFAATESGLRIIMEYVEGRTLHQRVYGDGPMAEVEVAAIACEVLDALEVIHDEDVIHRDIKPGNVMLDPHGRVKLMDFGIAMTDAADDDRTTENSVVGTIKFMAPEQSRAEPVTIRSDLFSVGATMAFCLLGDLPHILRPEDLPPRLRNVLVRAMAADSALRYASAAEMREAIEEAIHAEPPRPPRKKRRWVLMLAVPMGAAVGIALGGALLLFDLVTSQTSPDPPPELFQEDTGPTAIVIEDVPEMTIEDSVPDVSSGPATEDLAVIADDPPVVVVPSDDTTAPEPPPTVEPIEEPVVPTVAVGPPAIKHQVLQVVSEGEPARFEVRVVGDLSYEVFVAYRATTGGSWRNLELRYRGNELYTGTLRIGGELSEGFAYYVTVIEDGAQGQVYTRGSTGNPFDVQVR